MACGGRRMFDFQKWRRWMEAKEQALKADGYDTRFAAGPNSGPKPGMILEITDGKKYGGFESWDTGETDYTVQVLSEAPNMRFHKWGAVVTDETFESLFQEFWDHYLA
jgi:hypothetical protein